MTFKAYEVSNNSDQSSSDNLNSRKSSTLPFFIKQLEHVISEEEKAVAFKTNLLKWAIKADNIIMATNQSQFIILKSREIDMLNDVHSRVINWSKNSPSAYQPQLENHVVNLLKTALHLIEDIPTNASYVAFKQLAELLKNKNESSSCLELYQLKNISDEEKTNLIKKYIIDMSAETPIPDEMQKLAFGGSDFRRSFFNGRPDDYHANTNKNTDSTISSRIFPESISLTEDAISQKHVPVLAKSPKQQLTVNDYQIASGKSVNGAPSKKEKPQIKLPNVKASPYYSTQFQHVQTLNRPSTARLTEISSPPTASTEATRLSRSLSRTSVKEVGSFAPETTPTNYSRDSDGEALTAGRRSFNLLRKNSITVKPTEVLADLRANSASVSLIRENYFASKSNSRGTRDHCPKEVQKESLISPHVPLDFEATAHREENTLSYNSDYDYVLDQNNNSQASTTSGNQDHNANEGFNSRGLSVERDQQLHSQTVQRNKNSDFDGHALTMPWYYQHIEKGVQWKSKNSGLSESIRNSTIGKSPRSEHTRQSIRNFFFNESGNFDHVETRDPTLESGAENSRASPQLIEEPEPLTKSEKVLSRRSSTSSVSSFIPNSQYGEIYSMNSNGNSGSYSSEPNYGNEYSYTRSPSNSGLSNSETTSAIIGVRERVKDYQQRDKTTSTPLQRFPPLNLIPQLRQQSSELTGVWVERLSNKLKQFLDSSSVEYDVILRWILTCGSIPPSKDASVKRSVDDILSKISIQDFNGGESQSRTSSPVKTVKKVVKEVRNGNPVAKVNLSSLDSKTYRPSIRKWRFGVRDIEAATIDRATAKSVRWAYPDIATVVEFNQQLSSTSCESVFIC